jgi:hypothetical protein
LLGKLVEKLLAEIAGKNTQIAELTEQKNLISSKLGVSADDAEIARMQAQLEKLISDFEKVISERV